MNKNNKHATTNGKIKTKLPFKRLERLLKIKHATNAALPKTKLTIITDIMTMRLFDNSAVSTYSVETTFNSPTSDEAITKRKTKE